MQQFTIDSFSDDINKTVVQLLSLKNFIYLINNKNIKQNKHKLVFNL